MLYPLLAAAPITARALLIEGFACVLVGSSITVLFMWVMRVLQSEDLAQGAEWRYDVSRMNELRRADTLYRLFYPLVGIPHGREPRFVCRDSLAGNLS